jgi:hypothetical protein
MATTPAASPGRPSRQVWQSGAGRRLTLAFVVLILLPFYASLGPMLFQRITAGALGDTVALALFGLAFSALMALLLQQLIHAIRTRIVVDDGGIELTVPRVGARGPFFLWRYVTAKLAYADIAAIERRTEVYGGAWLPMLLTSVRLVPKTGEPIVLGYTNAHEQDDQFPYGDIAARIARSAGIGITDHGTVRRSLQQRVLGMKSTGSEPLPVAELEALNVAHTRNIKGLVVGLGVLLLVGIGIDVATASRTTYAAMGAGIAQSPPIVKKK